MVSFKGVPDVIAEVKSLVDCGYSRFHLCDSEFNEDLDYAVEFCTALKKSGLKIDWSVYMKPANYNKKLFRLMKETGVSLITLTVDSWKKCPLYWADIETMIFHGRSAGIRTAVDFLTGFPYEGEETLEHYLDLFRRTGPDSVGINTYIRLYHTLPITNIIVRDVRLRANLTGEVSDKSFVRPVFYNQVSAERLQEIIKHDKLFRIEGLEKGVNYLRAQ
jgi:biotin synthase-like enzyme